MDKKREIVASLLALAEELEQSNRLAESDRLTEVATRVADFGGPIQHFNNDGIGHGGGDFDGINSDVQSAPADAMLGGSEADYYNEAPDMQQASNHESFDRLVEKYLSGQISEPEYQELLMMSHGMTGGEGTMPEDGMSGMNGMEHGSEMGHGPEMGHGLDPQEQDFASLLGEAGAHPTY